MLTTSTSYINKVMNDVLYMMSFYYWICYCLFKTNLQANMMTVWTQIFVAGDILFKIINDRSGIQKIKTKLWDNYYF